VPDFKTDYLQIAAQLMIPKPKHFDALMGKKFISSFIACALVWKPVATSVKFHGQFRDCAIEIQKISPARVLAAKFEFVEPTVA
jgi:hypothetical protein